MRSRAGATIGRVTSTEHPMVAHVQQVLREAGATGEVVHLADSARTAQEAADALGVEVGAIASSLVFEVGGNPVLVLTSGAHRVDTAKVAGLLGVPELRKASAAFVREHTGQAIGGVAPVGHPEPIGTLVDITLARFPQVWAAAGHPHAVFPTSYDELLRITAGTAAEVDGD